MEWFLDKALLVYYFNIIMISGIIFIVLMSWYKKMGSVIVNSGEKSSPMNDNVKFPPTVKYVVIFGLIFFTIREYGGDLLGFIENGFEWLGDKIDG